MLAADPVHLDIALRQRLYPPFLGSSGKVVQERERQRELARIGAFKAGAADHGITPVVQHVGPHAVPEQFDRALGAVGRQNTGAAELQKLAFAMTRQERRDVEFAGAVKAATALSDLLAQ